MMMYRKFLQEMRHCQARRSGVHRRIIKMKRPSISAWQQKCHHTFLTEATIANGWFQQKLSKLSMQRTHSKHRWKKRFRFTVLFVLPRCNKRTSFFIIEN